MSRKKQPGNYVKKPKSITWKKERALKSAHKVLIIGDSHIRGWAMEVKLKLKGEYEVIGFTNPGSTMKTMKEPAITKISQLTKEDIVVLCGGSKDVAKIIHYQA